MFKQKILRETKIMAVAAVIGLLVAPFTAMVLSAKDFSDTKQATIAANVIRFHVLANSDDDADQALKRVVRDGVLDAFQDGLSASNAVDETRAFLATHLDDIRAYAENLIAENGYDYTVTVSLSRDYFPTKAYGDVVFPAGEYEALRIVIGEGTGYNWWCVMFPPLCFVDVTQGVIDEDGKQLLQNVLAEDDYRLLTYTENDMSVKVRFKIVEWFQQRKQAQKAQYVQK